MGKPRLIILVRHAQSEGNKNRAIHQVVPDHRVKLTDEGHVQAAEAGHRLRALLRPDDTLQIFTSPYRRTRETTEGILKTLTSTSEDGGPSPFSRSKIKLYEEPRLREQDFGNFQPCSAEMERMWQERADYGHFFYRIPNGESAADAYDRVSGFNESLWRQFGDGEFPSVLVLVTHGLMTRVFLMKWYHWSVEYFEDLRNVNHCEFVLMRLKQDSGKYILDSELRTWSEYKRQKRLERAERDEEEARRHPSRRNTLSAFLQAPPPTAPGEKSPSIAGRQWGGCVDGCKHDHVHTRSRLEDPTLPPPAAEADQPAQNRNDDHALGPHEPAHPQLDGPSSSQLRPPAKAVPSYLSSTAVSSSGDATPHEMPSDDEIESYPFPEQAASTAGQEPEAFQRSIATAMRRKPERKATPEDIERWTNESGMGRGKEAERLGDEPEELEEAEKEDRSLRGSVY